MKKGLLSILFLAVMLFGMTAMVAGQDSGDSTIVVSDSVIVTDPGPLTVDDLLLALIPAILGFVSKAVVDAGVRFPNIPNYLVALGAIFGICLLIWLLSLILHFNPVLVIAAVMTGYFGGSVKGTWRK